MRKNVIRYLVWKVSLVGLNPQVGMGVTTLLHCIMSLWKAPILLNRPAKRGYHVNVAVNVLLFLKNSYCYWFLIWIPPLGYLGTLADRNHLHRLACNVSNAQPWCSLPMGILSIWGLEKTVNRLDDVFGHEMRAGDGILTVSKFSK